MIYLTLIFVLIIMVGIINCLFSNNSKEMAEIFQNRIDDSNKINTAPTTQASPNTEQPAQNKIIVWFKGLRYDVTNFVKKHPGGKIVLEENNGKDVEKLMLENGHSENAYKLLEKYRMT